VNLKRGKREILVGVEIKAQMAALSEYAGNKEGNIVPSSDGMKPESPQKSQLNG